MTTTVLHDELLEEPRWFGPEERPLFGWLTWRPGVPSRGGVFLAPPIGREARAARRALRRCALELAERGFVALRFDYDGTGDSAGAFDDADRDVAWTASVAEAAALLRSAGLTSVSAVGMRLGATILGAAAGTHELALRSLVLWDPCESGRSYLRQLGALETLRRDHVDAVEGTVETAEYLFSAQTATELRRLSLLSAERAALATRILVVARDDRAVTDAMRAGLGEDRVTWATTSEQGRLLDVDPLVAVLPERTISTIVSWLGEEPALGVVPEAVPGGPSAVVSRETAPHAVRERCVHLGPNELFGIVSEPDGESGGPLVVLLNVATDEHTGPSRLWVELSRRWAAHGLQCVRFDLSGVGDSPWRRDEPETAMYDAAWLDDMRDVATALRPEDPSRTVFVGLCSGAYLAVEAGIALRSAGVCVINPPAGMDLLSSASRLARSRRAWVRALAARTKELALRARWLAVALWQVARVIMPPVFNVDVLSRLVDGGTDLYVLASTEDLSPSPAHPRLDRLFSPRLVRPSAYEVHFVPGLDHSMLAAQGRARTVSMLDHHVLGRFAPQAAAGHDDGRGDGEPR